MKDGMADRMLAGSLSNPDLAPFEKNSKCQGVQPYHVSSRFASDSPPIPLFAPSGFNLFMIVQAQMGG